MNERWSAVVIC